MVRIVLLVLLFGSFISFAGAKCDLKKIGKDSLNRDTSVLIGDKDFVKDQRTSIVFLSGDALFNVKVDSIDREFVYYKRKKTQHKTDVAKVFSFTVDSSETVLYVQDSIVGNDLSVDQMRDFILGEQVAKTNHKIRLATCSSIIVGGLSGALSFWGIPIPVVYSLILNPINPHKAKTELSDCRKNKDCFDAGYKSGAKNKKMKATLISGLSSFVLVACLVLVL